jgi:hypothetical protein
MSDTQRGPEPSCLVTTYQYDPEGRLVSVEAPTPPGSKWEHDEAKRLFRITEVDGNTIDFHGRAVRFLVVAPDPRTGKLEPVISWGVPRIMYLCREAGL